MPENISPRAIDREKVAEATPAFLPPGTAAAGENLRKLFVAIGEGNALAVDTVKEMMRDTLPNAADSETALAAWEFIAGLSPGGADFAARRARVISVLTARGGCSIPYLRSIVAAAEGAPVADEFPPPDSQRHDPFFIEFLPFRAGDPVGGHVTDGAIGVLRAVNIDAKMLQEFAPAAFPIYDLPLIPEDAITYGGEPITYEGEYLTC